jgi:hypothetical protein
MTYFVTPLDEKRSQKWEKAYGRSILPVKYAQPHLACTQRWGTVPVYYLDPTAVPDALLDRLATFEAKRLGISYGEARLNVRQEWLIQAEGCHLEKSAPQEITPWQTAFPFLQQVPLHPRPHKIRKPRRLSHLRQSFAATP